VVAGLTEMGNESHWVSSRIDEVRESACALGLDRFRLRATVAQVREFAARAASLANNIEPVRVNL